MFLKYLTWLLRRKRFYFSLALITGLIWIYDSATDRLGDREFVYHLSNNPFGYRAEAHRFWKDGRRIRYIEIGSDHQPLIVFIHGAPSSSIFWKEMMENHLLLKRSKLLAVDRPGYGYSGYGRPEPSVKKQAELISIILKEKRKKHSIIIVHGSSYGGTVAARLAMDYPKLVDGLLLQSASLKPGAETTFDISYPTNHWSLAWLVPGSLRTANAEKLSHRQQLKDMANGWDHIRANCIILHGKADRLIFPENASYAFDKLRNAASANLTFIPNSKHDLLYTQNPLLVQSLIRLVDCCMLSNGSVLAKR